MKTRHNRKNATKSGAILCGSSICILSFLAVMLLFSIVLCLTKDPLSSSDKFSPLAFATAGMLAGIIGRRVLSEGRIFLFCPPLLLLAVLLLGLLLSEGRISISALLSEGIYLGCCYFSFFVFAKRARRRGKRH